MEASETPPSPGETRSMLIRLLLDALEVEGDLDLVQMYPAAVDINFRGRPVTVNIVAHGLNWKKRP